MATENTASKKQVFTVKEMAFTAMFAALLAVCSWISIPLAVPITLQTFAVFAAVALLGTKCSFTAITVWILLGAVGVPVFANFKSGIATLSGPTGGYILGMLLCPLVYAGVRKLFCELRGKIYVKALGMVLGLLVCYAFGTVWFIKVFTQDISVIGALKLCVFPFLAFDAIKIALALVLDNRLGKFIGIAK